MKTAEGLLALALVFCVGGCSSTGPEASRHVFPFTYEGSHYEIISVVLPEDGGSNYLSLRDGEQVLLQAKDRDQDGTLDTVMVGAVTLEEANALYEIGIAEARAQGKYRAHVSARVYQVTRGDDVFVVQTYVVDQRTSYNKFVFYEGATGQETVLVDTNADGMLDEVESGARGLEACQDAYDRTLREGLRDGRIVLVDGTYVVEPNRTSRRLSRTDASYLEASR